MWSEREVKEGLHLKFRANSYNKQKVSYPSAFSKKKKKRWGEGEQMENRGTNERHSSLSLTVRISIQNVSFNIKHIQFLWPQFHTRTLSMSFFSSSWNLPAQELKTFNALLPLDQNLRSRMFIHLKGTRQPWAEADPKGKIGRSGGHLKKVSSLCPTISPGKMFGASHPDPITRRMEVSPAGSLFSILPSWPQSLHLTSEGRTERIWVDAYFQIWISVSSLGAHLLNWKMRGLNSDQKVSPSAEDRV